MTQKIEEVLIEIALKHARLGRGSLFVIMKNKIDYSLLLGDDLKPFNIFENQRRLELLSGGVDGATIIDENGMCIGYSAQILNVKPFSNYGLRHASAATASQNGNVAIISSEEDRKVKIFKNGNIVIQLDPLEKNIEKQTFRVVTILESCGAGLFSIVGLTLVAPQTGITLIPGVIIFGSLYHLIKTFRDKMF